MKPVLNDYEKLQVKFQKALTIINELTRDMGYVQTDGWMSDAIHGDEYVKAIMFLKENSNA
jgi:hypothetical protein